LIKGIKKDLEQPMGMDKHLKIAVFIDFDNIEIGVKSTLQREFDVSIVLEALKERGEIVTKIAYANWGRQDTHTRALSEHAVQMVQRDPSPRGDKNGADINLALDALEMAFTHDHINAFAIVSGDSDFIALVNKLKQYDKTVFILGGRAFTSTILQKNCHEFISYESLMDEPGARPERSERIERAERAERPERAERAERQERPAAAGSVSQTLPGESRALASAPPPYEKKHFHDKPHFKDRGGEKRGRPPALDLGQAMPLVERALQVLERREVRPQLGLLKSTMLQLDSSFSERAYGASSFTDFVEKLRKNDYVIVTGGEGRYMIQRKHGGAAEKLVRPEGALPVLRDVLESHRLEMEDGVLAEDLLGFVKEEQPTFDWKNFGFQEFSELLNFAQDKGVTRIVPDEVQGIMVYLGAEFHPPAIPDAPIRHLAEPEEERQPVVKGQPTAREPRVKRTPRKTAARLPSLATSLPVDDEEDEGMLPDDEPEDDFIETPIMPDPEPEPEPVSEPEPAPEPVVEPVSEPEPEPQPEPEAAPATTSATAKRARKLPTRRTSKKAKPAAEPEAAPEPTEEA
jgi:uncharacterized protein (TIGR00288 family)